MVVYTKETTDLISPVRPPSRPHTYPRGGGVRVEESYGQVFSSRSWVESGDGVTPPLLLLPLSSLCVLRLTWDLPTPYFLYGVRGPCVEGSIQYRDDQSWNWSPTRPPTSPPLSVKVGEPDEKPVVSFFSNGGLGFM